MLTEDQKKKKLYTAIDKAEGYGFCRYVISGQPCCVVARVAALEGVGIETMAGWRSITIEGVRVDNHRVDASTVPAAIELQAKYPEGLLNELQAIWDGRGREIEPPVAVANEHEARIAMRAVVDRYAAAA